MTVSTTESRIEHAGNGVTTTFPIPFRFLENSHIQITLVSSTGEQTLLSQGTDYTLLGANADDGGAALLTFAPALESYVIILRVVPATQETDYISGDPFPAESHERALDKLTMLIQQAEEANSRTLKFPVGDLSSQVGELPPASQRANSLLAFDSLGRPSLSVPSDQSAVGLALALSAASGSNLVGFQQIGDGSVPYTAQEKMRLGAYDLRDAGVLDLSGVTEMTSTFLLAATLASMQGRALRLPPGTLLLDPVALPTTLPAMFCDSGVTTLRFKRQVYPAGQVLLNASANTAGLRLSNIRIDCDDTVFETAGIYALVLNGSNNWRLDDVTVRGRGQSGVFTNASANGVARNLVVECTGVAGATFHTGFEGQNCFNVVVQMRTTGLPSYSGTFGAGSFFSKFERCHTEGTSGSFGYSLGGTAYCGIYGCTARNTSHEAFQITDGYYNVIDHVICEWDNDKGVDAGISIHGKTLQTRLNRVSNATVINSYGPGLLCADNAQGNSFSDCILKDCSVRGYAAAPDPSSAVIGQYTEIAGVQCTGQTFRDIKVLTETGPVLNGYSEANNGVGATIAETNLIDIEWQGGGTITQRYKTLTGTSARIWDLTPMTVSITATSGAGSITAYTGNLRFRYRGATVELLRLGISITASTGTGDLTVLWPNGPVAIANGGAVSGRDLLTGKGVMGVVNANGVVLRLADNTTCATAGTSMVLTGSCEIA